jgi:hypothetical protein
MINKNNMQYLKFVVVISITACCILSCGKKKDDGVPVVKMPVKKAETVTGLAPKNVARYKYGGDYFRDPFVSLSAEGGKFFSSLLKDSGEAQAPNLGALVLKGVITDKTSKIALLWSPAGSYFLKNGNIYDGRNRLVRGYSGTIKDGTVVITTEDKFTRELKIRETNR